MPLQNPSFEDAGTLPGEAAHWMLSAMTSLEQLAAFGAAPEEAWEDFERWYPRLNGFDDVSTVRAFFDDAFVGYEAFEAGWANAVYLHELPPAQLVTATFDGRAMEDCETGWVNVPYARAWNEVVSAPGAFDEEAREDFEERWRMNQAYSRTWADVSAVTADFGTAGDSAEDFDDAWIHASSL